MQQYYDGNVAVLYYMRLMPNQDTFTNFQEILLCLQSRATTVVANNTKLFQPKTLKISIHSFSAWRPVLQVPV